MAAKLMVVGAPAANGADWQSACRGLVPGQFWCHISLGLISPPHSPAYCAACARWPLLSPNPAFLSLKASSHLMVPGYYRTCLFQSHGAMLTELSFEGAACCRLADD